MQQVVWNGAGEGTIANPFYLEVVGEFRGQEPFNIRILTNYEGYVDDYVYFRFSNHSTVYSLALIVKDASGLLFYKRRDAIHKTMLLTSQVDFSDGPYTILMDNGVTYIVRQQIFSASEAITLKDVEDLILVTVTPLLELKVDKTAQIAGIEIQEGISKETLLEALNVEDGAEKNVQSDWDAVDGDAFIKNKPAVFPPAEHTHPIEQVDGLREALDERYTKADVYDLLQGKIDKKFNPTPTAEAMIDDRNSLNVSVKLDEGNTNWEIHDHIRDGVLPATRYGVTTIGNKIYFLGGVSEAIALTISARTVLYSYDIPTKKLTIEYDFVKEQNGTGYYFLNNSVCNDGVWIYIMGGYKERFYRDGTSTNRLFFKPFKINILTKEIIELSSIEPDKILRIPDGAVYDAGKIYISYGMLGQLSPRIWIKTNKAKYDAAYEKRQLNLTEFQQMPADASEMTALFPLSEYTYDDSGLIFEVKKEGVDSAYFVLIHAALDEVALRTRLSIYDIATDTWEIRENAPTAGGTTNAQGNSILIDGNIYVKRSALFNRYNIATNTWTILAEPIVKEVHGESPVFHDGHIYYGSGYIGINTPGWPVGNPGVIHRYHIATDTWSIFASLPKLFNDNQGYGSLGLVGNNLYYMLGYSGEFLVPERTLTNPYVYKYDLTKGPSYGVESGNLIEIKSGGLSVDKDKIENLIVETVEPELNKKATKIELANTEYNLQTQLDDLTFVKSAEYEASNDRIKITYRNNNVEYVPIADAIKSGYYDEATKEIVLVLSDDTEIKIPAEDITSGLASEAFVNAGLVLKENVANKTDSWQTIPDNQHYPSEKLVNDTIQAVRQETQSELAGKLDKITTASTYRQLYRKNADGTNDMVNLVESNLLNSVPVRDSRGAIKATGGRDNLDLLNVGQRVKSQLVHINEDYSVSRWVKLLEFEINSPWENRSYRITLYPSVGSNYVDLVLGIRSGSAAEDVTTRYFYNISSPGGNNSNFEYKKNGNTYTVYMLVLKNQSLAGTISSHMSLEAFRNTIIPAFSVDSVSLPNFTGERPGTVVINPTRISYTVEETNSLMTNKLDKAQVTSNNSQKLYATNLSGESILISYRALPEGSVIPFRTATGQIKMADGVADNDGATLGQLNTELQEFKNSLPGMNLVAPTGTFPRTVNGVTIDYDDGIFTLNGTATYPNDTYFNIIMFSGDYKYRHAIAATYISGAFTSLSSTPDNITLLGTPYSNDRIIQFKYNNNSKIWLGDFTHFNLQLRTGQVFSNYKFKIMLTKGSEVYPYTPPNQIPDYIVRKPMEWITPTLLGGATGTVQYMKDELGFVHIEGSISSPNSGAPYMSLPVGYKPTSGHAIIISTTEYNTADATFQNNGSCYGNGYIYHIFKGV